MNHFAHLEHFVARFIARLPDKTSERKEDLVTLLTLLPKDYPRRAELNEMLHHLLAHEAAQLNFPGSSKPGTRNCKQTKTGGAA